MDSRHSVRGNSLDKSNHLRAGLARPAADEVELMSPYNDPERRDWFVEQVKPLGLDPAKTTLFDWLEADDKACHAQAA